MRLHEAQDQEGFVLWKDWKVVTEHDSQILSANERKCQGCGSNDLETVLDLGYQPLCNEFLPSDMATGPRTYYPLCLCYCHQCTLVQLDYVIPTHVTFGDQYTYLTGSSASLIEYYTQLAGRLVDRLGLGPGDTVLDIGCNDGTFLKAFQSLGVNRREERLLSDLHRNVIMFLFESK